MDFQKATLTFYNDQEDKYGSLTSKPNPKGMFRAIDGVTIAVDPDIIRYGSWVEIPELKEFSLGKDGLFYAHDTGSAVKQKIASQGRGNNYPVIDVFTTCATEKLSSLNEKYGDTVTFKIL